MVTIYIVGLTTEGWLNARAGWTTQGSRILLSTTTITPDPVPGARGDHRAGTHQFTSERGTKMIQTEELATQLSTRGRQIKFTPERLEQVRNLVERGKSREEIAELIGVTV